MPRLNVTLTRVGIVLMSGVIDFVSLVS